MITPAYESFVNNVCADNEYDIANENAIIDGAKKIWETIKALWKKFVAWVTSMVQKLIGLFKKPPKEATVEEIKKADEEVSKKSKDSKFDKNTSNVTSLPEKAETKEDIRKRREEMIKRNKAKDDAAAKKDEDEKNSLYEHKAYTKYIDELGKKQEEQKRKREEQKRIEDEYNKQCEAESKKFWKAYDEKIVKNVIISEDAFYWVTNGYSYVKDIGMTFNNIIEIAKDGNSTIDDIKRDVKYIDSCMEDLNPNDLHTLEDDYINGDSGTAKSKKVGYMDYDNFMISSKRSVKYISGYINDVNKSIQNISEIHDTEIANKVLELSRKLIPFFQQILNNVNSAIQSVRVVTIRRKNRYGKNFD